MKIFYLLMTLSVTFIICLLNSFESNAQTNPAVQSLPYTQNFTSLVATSTTYPAGLQGWNLSTGGSSTAFRTIAPPVSSDLALIASATAASTTAGVQNYNGKIGILSSTTADPSLCLAISTTGFFTVAVNFDIMTIRNPFDGSANTRINQVDLQYRVGTTGAFTSVTGVTNGVYQNNTTNQTGAVTTPQNSLAKIQTLPAACNNQPVVQIRWVQRDFSGIGTLRPSFAIDNISICATAATPTITILGPSAFCSGGTATYTAAITNGGTTPTYQWKKNGVNISTNTPTPTISGLIVSDQITCTLTSNLSCVTANVVTSNTITIGVINSSPTISSANITNVSCPNAHNGAIDITVTGGTPPYTINWDTTNTANGPLFGVTVGLKSPTNPLFGQGNPNGYIIDGVEEKELFLTRGITYSFNVLTPAHPFHISTDNVGGNANFIVTNGQSGAPTQSGTVTFRPTAATPSLLYYPCQFHQFMGYKVNVQNGFASEDLSNRHAGTYTVVVTDANGCTVTSQYTLIELPSPVTLSATITNATCTSPSGAIDLSVSGGVAPYIITWDTINTSNGANYSIVVGNKTGANPYALLGYPACFYIDGDEAKTLTLARGINYTFNILSPGHPWHISTDSIGGSSIGLVTNGQTGAPIDNGTVFFKPNNLHPSLLRYDCANHQYMGGNVNIINGYNIEDLSNIHPGKYTVNVVDANGCLASAEYTVGSIPSNLSISAVVTNTDCNIANGAIDLTVTNAFNPYTVTWDTFNTSNGPTFGVMIGDKTLTNPYSGLGNPSCFYINGEELKELSLVKNISYTFNVFNPGHTFHISTDLIGGNSNNIVTSGQFGAPIDDGTVLFTPNSSHPRLLRYVCGIHEYMGYNINIIDGNNSEDLNQLGVGTYTVNVTDSFGCSANASYIVNFNGTCNVTLNLKAFIQGLYVVGGSLQPTLYSLGLSTDPTESDSITVELHDATDPNIIGASTTAILHTDGIAQLQFPGAVIGNSYYIVLRNRNSMETWSKDPILFDNAIMSFDFTN